MIHLTDKEVHVIIRELKEVQAGAAIIARRLENISQQMRTFEETKRMDDLAPMRSTNRPE